MNTNVPEKKWDVYVYGDINIDLVIPGVDKFPKPGQEDEVDVMETFVGGGAALFTLGVGKLGLHPVFQGTIGDNLRNEMWIPVFWRFPVSTRREFLSVLPMKRTVPS